MVRLSRWLWCGIPCPYQIKGSHVPIYSMANGRISKRNWVFKNPQWCSLCKEPVALWVNHHGRKDHALMDLHYTQHVEWPRAHEVDTVLHTFLSCMGIPVEGYYKFYARYEGERRHELVAMLKRLEQIGMISFGDPKDTFLSKTQGGLRGMDHQGALVLHRFILGPFMRLYPEGGIQDFSNLVDFCTCSYNMETVYDLCGFHGLDTMISKDARPSSPAALGLGGIAASSSATTGFVNSAGKAATAQGALVESSHAAVPKRELSDQEESEAFSRKAVFVRQLLGQLRWADSEDKVHPVPERRFAPHEELLGETCLKLLVAEVLAVRLCEYMVRVEPVWREHGLERKVVDLRERLQDQVPPCPIRFHYRPMSAQMDDLYHVQEVPTPPTQRRGGVPR